MLTYKKDSWHYQFLSGTGAGPSNDFCTHWRRVILYGFLFIVGVIGLILIGGFLAFVAISPLLWHFSLIPGDHGAIGVAVLGYILALIYFLGKWTIEGFMVASGTVKERLESNPSVVATWIKAHKEKFCPRIEWVDGD